MQAAGTLRRCRRWTPEEDDAIRAAADRNREPGGYTRSGFGTGDRGEGKGYEGRLRASPSCSAGRTTRCSSAPSGSARGRNRRVRLTLWTDRPARMACTPAPGVDDRRHGPDRVNRHHGAHTRSGPRPFRPPPPCWNQKPDRPTGRLSHAQTSALSFGEIGAVPLPHRKLLWRLIEEVEHD